MNDTYKTHKPTPKTELPDVVSVGRQEYDHLPLRGKKEVVKLLGISQSSIMRKVREGTFPAPLQISENRVVWRNSDLMRWLDGLPSSRKARHG